MLARTGPNQVTSDTGFVVQVLGRTGIEYREAGRVAFVDSEVLADSGMAIYRDSIVRWKSPHDVEAITVEKKKEILDRVVTSLKYGWPTARIEIL